MCLTFVTEHPIAAVGNEKALATVTAIIDGMGSIGAALGPTLTGYISSLPGGFNNVFYMLYISALCAGKHDYTGRHQVPYMGVIQAEK